MKENNFDSIKVALVSSFFWGIVAHAYGFLHGSLTHDSLADMNAAEGDNLWKIALGRVLVPLYHTLTRGDVTLPWMNGVLAMVYIALAVFLVTKIFKVQSKLLIFIVAGIFVVNNTVTATAATYMHDFDQNIFALFCSVGAVYLWQRSPKGFLLAIIPVGISMALYQAYISVSITLIMIILLLGLFEGEEVKSVFIKGMKALAMLLGGSVIYFLLVKFVLFVTATELRSGRYNSVDIFCSMSIERFAFCIAKGYFNSVRQFVDVVSAYPRLLSIVLHFIFLFIGVWCVISGICSKKMTVGAKVLSLLLIGLLPIGVNAVYPLTNGMSHDLMHFG